MNMKKSRLTLLIILVGLIFCSCGGKDTQYVASYSKTKIPTGVYVMYEQYDAVSAVLDKLIDDHPELAEKSPDTKEFFETALNGRTVEQMVIERAKTELQIHVGAEKLFEELKLELSAEQLDTLKQAQRTFRDAEASLATKGIGREAYLAYYDNYEKYKSLFEHYYGASGEKKPSDEKLRKYFDDHYLKLSTRTFYYGTDEESKTKTKKTANEFLESVSKLGFAEAWRLDEVQQAAKMKEAEEERKKLEAEERAKHPDWDFPEGKEEEEKLQEKEETLEEARQRLENSNTKTSSKRDLRLIIGTAGLKQIEDAQINLPFLIDVPAQNTMMLVIKQANEAETFEALKSTLLFDSSVLEFEEMLIARGQLENLKFNETAIEAFRPIKLCAKTPEKETASQ